MGLTKGIKSCYYIINFDGSVLPNGNSSAGFIIHVTNAKPLIARSSPLGHKSVLQAEALALKQAIYIGIEV